MNNVIRPLRALPGLVLFGIVLTLVATTSAVAETLVHNSPTLVFTPVQMWAAILGLLTPLVSYALNTRLWADAPEEVKTFIHVLVAAVVAAVYTAIESPTFGWNSQTLQLLGTTILVNFFAHFAIWKPSGVQARLTRQVPPPPAA